VNSVAFNKDSTIIVSGSYDSTVKIWDCRTVSKRPIQTLTDAKDSVETVYFHEFEVIAAGVDGCIRVYDIRTRKVVIDSLTRPITSAVLSNDKNCILVSCLDNVLRLIDKEEGQILSE
jgi:mitogen-activated protein kinase organizer 1